MSIFGIKMTNGVMCTNITAISKLDQCFLRARYGTHPLPARNLVFADYTWSRGCKQTIQADDKFVINFSQICHISCPYLESK